MDIKCLLCLMKFALTRKCCLNIWWLISFAIFAFWTQDDVLHLMESWRGYSQRVCSGRSNHRCQPVLRTARWIDEYHCEAKILSIVSTESDLFCCETTKDLILFERVGIISKMKESNWCHIQSGNTSLGLLLVPIHGSLLALVTLQQPGRG